MTLQWSIIRLRTRLIYNTLFILESFRLLILRNLLAVAFLSYDVVLKFFRLRSIHIFKATRFLHAQSTRVKKARECVKSVQ